MSTFTA